jgi:catechol 2,3-dioxygenase-like lactoylglutathione lyase family enzyme
MIGFQTFSHVSVTVTDVEKARWFYGQVLGLSELPRPDFGFPGIWYRLAGSASSS